MKVLLLLLVVGFAVWLLRTKARGAVASTKKPAPAPPPKAADMLACAHCGVHLPQPDVLFDAAGRAFCSQAHRLAGPR